MMTRTFYIFNKRLFICFCFHTYSKYVLNEPDSIEDGIGIPDWRLTLCLLFSWITVFLVIIRGVKSSGKAAYFLALFPYVIMIALLVRGATLPGAGKGILFFIEPQWEELLNPQVNILGCVKVAGISSVVTINKTSVIINDLSQLT